MSEERLAELIAFLMTLTIYHDEWQECLDAGFTEAEVLEYLDM